MDRSDPEELLGEKILDFGDQALEDLEPPCDPGLALPDGAGNGVGGEGMVAVEIPQDLELLGEGGPAFGIVPPEPLELRLDLAPRLHDDPGRRGSLGPEGEEALEPIDQEELLALLDDHKRLLLVHRGVPGHVAEELQGDPLQGDLTDGHAAPPAARAPGKWDSGTRRDPSPEALSARR